MAKYPIVLKMDADVLIWEKLFSQNPIESRTFYTMQGGDWDLIPSGLSGLFLFCKEDFDEVGGFNELLNGWGYEDVDLTNRFKRLHYKVKNLNYGSTVAIQHDNSDRGFGGISKDSERELMIKMLIFNNLNFVLTKLRPWSNNCKGSEYMESSKNRWITIDIPEPIHVDKKLWKYLVSECQKVFFFKTKGKIIGRLLHLLPYSIKKTFYYEYVYQILRNHPSLRLSSGIPE